MHVIEVFFRLLSFFIWVSFDVVKKICYQNSNSANGSANDFRNLVKIVYGLFKPTAHADYFVFFFGMCMTTMMKKKEKKID